MTEKISINGCSIAYDLRFSRRSKRLVLAVRSGERVTVSAPRFISRQAIREFIGQKSAWLMQKLEESRKNPGFRLGDNPAEYRQRKAEARKFVIGRLAFFNRLYGFKFLRVAIRNQRTRWGSCSKDGNLNFNYKIIFLPAELADYIIVHELCHLEEFNHSEKFWSLVARAMPEAKNLRKKFKRLPLQ